MKLSIFSWVFFVALFSTCRGAGEVDETINIDDGNIEPVALMDPAMLADSGSGIGMIPTDDEDVLGNIEGSGTTKINTVIEFQLTTLSPNKIPKEPENPMKPKPTIGNEIGPTYNEANNNRNSNDALNANNINAEKPQNIFEKILSNPAILAGMVGAVVLILLTVVLLFLFVIYRVKKKDEGSYSLDEPHKVKDPTAYWKDTKEFYA